MKISKESHLERFCLVYAGVVLFTLFVALFWVLNNSILEDVQHCAAAKNGLSYETCYSAIVGR